MKTIFRPFAALIAVFLSFSIMSPAVAAPARNFVVQKASVSEAAASGVTSAATNTVTVTVPGAALGDACIASHSVDASSLALTCNVTAANTVKVSVTNLTTNGAALSSGTMRVFLFPKGTR